MISFQTLFRTSTAPPFCATTCPGQTPSPRRGHLRSVARSRWRAARMPQRQVGHLSRYLSKMPNDAAKRALDGFKPIDGKCALDGCDYIQLIQSGHFCHYFVGGRDSEWFMDKVSCEFVSLCKVFNHYHNIRGTPDNSLTPLHMFIVAGPSWWAFALPPWIEVSAGAAAINRT